MSNKKKIVFLTGTRADFGKLKSLITILDKNPLFEVMIFVTGMHMLKQYGSTVDEIEKCGFTNIFKYNNTTSEKSMDLTLAKTIEGLSKYIKKVTPDMLIVHGDRVEALAGAIVGSLNNILVSHIEGGEVSGTIDELIRHSVTKMSHIHLASNKEAKARLLQMGESEKSIFVIGSPDIDIMMSEALPSYEESLQHYDIKFEEFSILMFHPVTTENDDIEYQAKQLVDAIIRSEKNYVVIYPNNDLGSNKIIAEYKRLADLPNIKIYPSIRFEYFLVLLKNAAFIIGNSSAGIREAPYYNVPTVNIGTRQYNRSLTKNILNCDYSSKSILKAIGMTSHFESDDEIHFGKGKSDEYLLKILINKNIWKISKQKAFVDIL